MYISDQRIPEDLVFDGSDAANPQLKSDQYAIYVGSTVKVRVLKTTETAAGVTVVGTMRDNYLG